MEILLSVGVQSIANQGGGGGGGGGGGSGGKVDAAED